MLKHVLILMLFNICTTLAAEITQRTCSNNRSYSLIEELLDRRNDTDTKSIIYGSEGAIRCPIRSVSNSIIHWHYIDTTGQIKEIKQSDDYDISNNGRELKIKHMNYNMVGRYACSVFYTQKVKIILVAPNITGEKEKKVVIGSNVTITCKIIQGIPLHFTWQFKNMSSSDFKPINASGNILKLSNVSQVNAGSYKCIAQNEAGIDSHITGLIVEFPPKIILKSSKEYIGFKGDLALRIPCEALGNPKPVNIWKIGGIQIQPNEKYSIEDGALIIKNLTRNDSLSYTCEAKNHIGSDIATFKTRVEEFISDVNIESKYIYLLVGETRKLYCEGYNSSGLVRWFIEDEEVGDKKKPYYEVVNANLASDGNYTCRVNDEHGRTFTHKYIVDVGYPPTLYEESRYLTNKWRGSLKSILYNCDSYAKPQAEVIWEFNGKVTTREKILQGGATDKWGHYKCTVSNVHGSVERSFHVNSSIICFIRRSLDDENIPLMLTKNLTWPEWGATHYDMVIQKNTEILLFCPDDNHTTNYFQKFTNKNELVSFCDHQDMFLVENKTQRVDDLLCKNKIMPTIKKMNKECITKTAELIKVGFHVGQFVETYSVCFDHHKNMPLRVLQRVAYTDDEPRFSTPPNDWSVYPGIGNVNINRGFTCKHVNETCCYDKTQLANPRYFIHGLAKKATFIDFLNVIPYWRQCANSSKEATWEDVERVVENLMSYDNLYVWTGVHTFQDINGISIPRYLYKVVKSVTGSSEGIDPVAIIYVNSPTPTEKDILCTAIDIDSMYESSPVLTKYTYACDFYDFLAEFDLQQEDFEI